MTVWTEIPTETVTDIRSELDEVIERLRGVIATDLIWKLELQSSRLNPECFPTAEHA
jgi:hypothetical protein